MNDTDKDISPNLSHKLEVDLFNPKAKHTARQRKRAMRERETRVYGRPPKNRDEKYIAKIGTLTMRQLIRRLHQAAREASHYKHLIARSGSYAERLYRPMQDYALMCFARLDTEIEFRTKGRAE